MKRFTASNARKKSRQNYLKRFTGKRKFHFKSLHVDNFEKKLQEVENIVIQRVKALDERLMND